MIALLLWLHAIVAYNVHHRRSKTRASQPPPAHAWAEALDAMPEPVFVSFGNAAYRLLLANFLCATARFEPMHKHTLILLTDNDTAAALRRIAPNATFVVLPAPTHIAHEAYAYGEPGYIELMRFRGHALLTLLERSWRRSNRTLLWLEADAHYRANLLTRAELTQSTGADVVLARDHGAYAGGFIRFAPTHAAWSFYAEIMRRMDRSRGLNDQALLNSVVRNYTTARLRTLDPCRYRSGAALLPRFRPLYRRLCRMRRAVIVQQHNWRVGAQAKIELARAEGGWFVADDNRTCI
jgi:hypothetical protein